jgi:hypothetical protein
MSGLSNYTAQAFLNYLVGKTTVPTLPANVYVALFTTMPTDAGTGGVEPATGGYARVLTSGASWNAASGSGPSTISNASSLAFPLATANYAAPIIGWGLFDASTGGNLLFADYIGGFNWVPFSATLASPSIITSPAHGFSNGDPVVVSSEFGGTLPTGFTAGVVGTVAGATTDTFNIGVNASTSGDGMLRKILQQTVVSGVTVTFNAGSLVMNLA